MRTEKRAKLSKTLKLEEIGEYIVLVTLNRPEFSNAFNTEMAWDLVKFFEVFSTEKTDKRVVILTGAGDKAFCAGGDLKERKNMTEEEWFAQHLVYERMIRSVINCPLPIIGAINGAAFGGGCELAAALDFIYVSQTAKFAQTEVCLGIIPGAGGTQTLARAIGVARATELILSGRVFSAEEAFSWGFANAIFSPDKLLEKTIEMARKIAENAPVAVKQAKQAIHKGRQMSLLDGLAFEIEAYNRTILTDDRKEGILAFNEKRKPHFKGR
ncbi:MAG: enoyl-CoA hydratase-related protein [Pseudomonadota bacterium]|nr:enoyl-CoA hydratase-related protein [Pseudomonadota bacterium]